jgi:monovalent cation:H+ antiporter-2, CPA2 family
VISAAVGVAYASAELFSVSFALGAFFAGMLMRESPVSYRAAAESLPLRDAFAVLFFISVGMLFQPEIVVREPLKLAAAIIMLGKTAAAVALVLLFRYPLNTALTVGRASRRSASSCSFWPAWALAWVFCRWRARVSCSPVPSSRSR